MSIMAITNSKIFNEGQLEMSDGTKVNVLMTEHLISSECVNNMEGLKVYYLINPYDENTFKIRSKEEDVLNNENFKYSIVSAYDFDEKTYVKYNKRPGLNHYRLKSISEYYTERIGIIKMFVITDKTGDCGEYLKAVRKAVAMYYERSDGAIKTLNDRFVCKGYDEKLKNLSRYIDLMSEATHILYMSGNNKMCRTLRDICTMYGLNVLNNYEVLNFLRENNECDKVLSVLNQNTNPSPTELTPATDLNSFDEINNTFDCGFGCF